MLRIKNRSKISLLLFGLDFSEVERFQNFLAFHDLKIGKKKCFVELFYFKKEMSKNLQKYSASFFDLKVLKKKSFR